MPVAPIEGLKVGSVYPDDKLPYLPTAPSCADRLTSPLDFALSKFISAFVSVTAFIFSSGIKSLIFSIY